MSVYDDREPRAVRHIGRNTIQMRSSEMPGYVISAAVLAIGAGDAKDWTQDSPEDAKRRLRAEQEGRE